MKIQCLLGLWGDVFLQEVLALNKSCTYLIQVFQILQPSLQGPGEWLTVKASPRIERKNDLLPFLPARSYEVPRKPSSNHHGCPLSLECPECITDSGVLVALLHRTLLMPDPADASGTSAPSPSVQSISPVALHCTSNSVFSPFHPFLTVSSPISTAAVSSKLQ